VVFASHSDMFHGLGDLTCSSGGRPVEPRLAFGCGVGFFGLGDFPGNLSFETSHPDFAGLSRAHFWGETSEIGHSSGPSPQLQTGGMRGPQFPSPLASIIAKTPLGHISHPPTLFSHREGVTFCD